VLAGITGGRDVPGVDLTNGVAVDVSVRLGFRVPWRRTHAPSAARELYERAPAVAVSRGLHRRGLGPAYVVRPQPLDVSEALGESTRACIPDNVCRGGWDSHSQRHGQHRRDTNQPGTRHDPGVPRQRHHSGSFLSTRTFFTRWRGYPRAF